jgi:hypothetical protein
MDDYFDNEFIPIPEHDCPSEDEETCKCFWWCTFCNNWHLETSNIHKEG